MSDNDREKSHKPGKVSKAPGPTRSGNTSHGLRISTAPADWEFWSQRINVELWEAVVLSVDWDPRHGSFGDSQKREEVLFGEQKPAKKAVNVLRDRIAIAAGHLSLTLKSSEWSDAGHPCHRVLLSDFATWAAYMKWRPIPQAFAGMANDQSVDEFAKRLVLLNMGERTRIPSTKIMTADGFVPLTPPLEPWFDNPLAEMPSDLQARVMSIQGVSLWDRLTAEQRRIATLQWDYGNDPAMENDRQQWWDFYVQMDELRQRITTWKDTATPTAVDLATKERCLAELRQELAAMELQERRIRENHSTPVKTIVTPPMNASGQTYIAYPRALKMLSEKLLNVTPGELAVWIYLEPTLGGIAAYQNANELDPPPRFHLSAINWQNLSYVEPMMGTWFLRTDIEAFQPNDRYITGRDLTERWGKFPGISPKAFIEAKIRESRLHDIYPTCGLTQASMPEDNFPPMEEGFYSLAEIEAIEEEDIGQETEQIKPSENSCHPVSAFEIRRAFDVVGSDPHKNEKWWKSKMRDAKGTTLEGCRVGQGKRGTGGSLWRPDLIAGWLVDRHTKGREGLTNVAARAALKKFPGCADVSEQMFPLN